MAYTKTQYVDGVTPLNAKNFNKNEGALEQVSKDIDALSSAITQVDSKVDGKANSNHTHSEYATKAYVDTELGKKSDKTNTYTKSEVDNKITEAQLGGGGSTPVIDNLTSTSTTSALSANQGKVLKDEITDLSSELEAKANNNEVIKKGYGTLNDFDEETRRVIQGIDSGQINAVLGDGNVMLKNLNDEIVKKIPGNNLLEGTQSITFTKDGKSYTYNATNFIQTGDSPQKYTFDFNWVWIIEYDLEGNFLSHHSNSSLYSVTIPANRKFALTNNDTTTLYNRDTLSIVKGSISNLIKDKLLIKKENLEQLNSDSIEDKSLSIDKFDNTFTTIENGNNLYKYDKHLNDYTIRDSNGDAVATSNFTNWIEVVSGGKYASSMHYTQYYFFDENKIYLSNITIITNPAIFTPPANCRYVLIRGDANSDIKICEGTSLGNVTNDKTIISPNLLPSSIGGYQSRWSGKKWVVIGDSISVLAEKNYHDFIAKDLGMNVVNLAVSGRTMLDGIGWVDTMTSAYDLVTVMMGTNDQGYNCGIGSFDDGVDFNTNGSFYARVQEMIRKLRVKNPNAQIVFITPIRRHGIGTQNNNSDGFMINALNKTTKEYVDVIKDCCNKLGVHCLDLYECGLDPRNETIRSIYFMGTGDGTHPSVLGQATFLAPKVRDFLEKIAPYSLT